MPSKKPRPARVKAAATPLPAETRQTVEKPADSLTLNRGIPIAGNQNPLKAAKSGCIRDRQPTLRPPGQARRDVPGLITTL